MRRYLEKGGTKSKESLEYKHDRSRTYGSNSWMTLSNRKTEKSLVEKAEEKEEHMDQWDLFLERAGSRVSCSGGLT